MSTTVKHQLGDWVRFYQNGRLVLGEVRYVLPDPLFPTMRCELITDVGSVNSHYVLETRPTPTEAPPMGRDPMGAEEAKNVPARVAMRALAPYAVTPARAFELWPRKKLVVELDEAVLQTAALIAAERAAVSSAPAPAGDAAAEAERLRQHARVIRDMLELGDTRVLAHDGPCGGQLPALSPDEWGKVYRAAKAIAGAAS